MGIPELIGSKREMILTLAGKYGVDRVRIFGSVARDEARTDSDVDFLVHFKNGRTLFDLIGFGQDVEELLGRKVDVLSERGVSPYMKDRIFKEAVPL